MRFEPGALQGEYPLSYYSGIGAPSQRHLGTSAVCGNYLLTSQTRGNALYSPEVTRNLQSVPRLINNGHVIQLEGSYPQIMLGSADSAYCIPLIHAKGYWLVPW